MSVRTVLAATSVPVAAFSFALLGAGTAAASPLPSSAVVVSVAVDGTSAAQTQPLSDLVGRVVVETDGAAGRVVQSIDGSDDPNHARVANLSTEHLTVTITREQRDGTGTVLARDPLTPGSTLVIDPDWR